MSSFQNRKRVTALSALILLVIGTVTLGDHNQDVRVNLSIPMHLEFSVEPYENHLPDASSPGTYLLHDPVSFRIVGNVGQGELSFASCGNLNYMGSEIPTWYMLTEAGTPRPWPGDPGWIPGEDLCGVVTEVEILGTIELELWCKALVEGTLQGRYTCECLAQLEADGATSNQPLAFVFQVLVPIEGTIDFDPNTLQVGSKGKYVTCYLELPEGYHPRDIDVSTVLLNDVLSAERRPTSVGDHDRDGIPDRIVKFDRPAVIDVLPVGFPTDVKVSWALTDGTVFAGSDTITVIDDTNPETTKRPYLR